MIEILALLALALAVSLDSYGVGLTYGLRKMRLPIKSLMFIAACSASSILVAMFFGNFLISFISVKGAESLGGIVLISIGLWALYQVFRPSKNNGKKTRKGMIANFEIKPLGLVIRILKKPMEADIDQSGTISGREAFLLGVALSLDAFGAGIGAVLIGFSPIWMALSVAVMSALFVSVGMKCGYIFAGAKWIRKFSFLPGVVLILLGLWKM